MNRYTSSLRCAIVTYKIDMRASFLGQQLDTLPSLNKTSHIISKRIRHGAQWILPPLIKTTSQLGRAFANGGNKNLTKHLLLLMT